MEDISKEFLVKQKKACKDSFNAFCFARDVKEANIKYCQKAACKSPYCAYLFAEYIKGADIEKCEDHREMTNA